MDSKFYSLARKTARIILENSWEAANVKDVVLYGSTLTQHAPKDIDLLILHFRGISLGNYTTNRSHIGDGKAIRYWEPIVMLHRLDYWEDVENGVFAKVAQLFNDEGIIQWDGKDYRPDKINEILDIHTLNTQLFSEPSDFKDPNDWETQYYVSHSTKLREKAIELSGRDPTFYHTALSSGKLYNPKTDDFTVAFEDKYPGKLALFPSLPETPLVKAT